MAEKSPLVSMYNTEVSVPFTQLIANCRHNWVFPESAKPKISVINPVGMPPLRIASKLKKQH